MSARISTAEVFGLGLGWLVEPTVLMGSNGEVLEGPPATTPSPETVAGGVAINEALGLATDGMGKE